MKRLLLQVPSSTKAGLGLLSSPSKLYASQRISSTLFFAPISNPYMPLLQRQFGSKPKKSAASSPPSLQPNSKSSASMDGTEIMTQLSQLQRKINILISQLAPNGRPWNDHTEGTMFKLPLQRRVEQAIANVFDLASKLPNGEEGIPLDLWRAMIEVTEVLHHDGSENEEFYTTTYKMYDRMLDKGKKRPDAALLEYLIRTAFFSSDDMALLGNWNLKDIFVINLVDDAVSENPALMTEALLNKMMAELDVSLPLCDFILKMALKHCEQYRGDYELMLKSNPLYLKCAVDKERQLTKAVDIFVQHATRKSVDYTSIAAVLNHFENVEDPSVFDFGQLRMLSKLSASEQASFTSLYKCLKDQDHLQSLGMCNWDRLMLIAASTPSLLPMVYYDRVNMNKTALTQENVHMVGHAYFKYNGQKPAELVQVYEDMKKTADLSDVQQMERTFKKEVKLLHKFEYVPRIKNGT